VNWRRARRFGVSAIALDIVFPFGKMSTKPDQAHERRVGLVLVLAGAVTFWGLVYAIAA
jgi:hypothetical protein